MRRVRYRGDFCPTLEAALVHELRACKAADPFAPVLVLCPTALLRAHLTRLCAEGTGGLIGVRFATLGLLRNELAGPSIERQGLGLAPAGAAEMAIARFAREGGLAGTDLEGAARSPGFAAAAFQTIRDLREAGLSPQALRSAARGPGSIRRAGPLADVLAAVDTTFREAGWVDDADVWERAAAAPPPDDRLVCLYGFYDLAARQWDLVRNLCRGQGDVVALVPDGAPEAFAFTSGFRQALEDLGFRDAQAPGASDPIEPGLKAIRERLFVPGAGPPVPDDGTLRILATPGEGREAREVARAALDAVRELGVPFREIGVLLRTEELLDPLLEAFDAAAVPTLARGPRAALAPGLRALRLLCDVRTSGFGRAALAELLTAEVLDPEALVGAARMGGFRPAGWDALTRRLGIVRGPAEFRRKLAGHARHLEGRAARGDPPRLEENQRLEALQAAIEVLDGALAKVPAQGRLAAFAEAFEGCRSLLAPGGAAVFDACVGSLCALDPAAGTVTLEEVTRLVERAGDQAGAPVGRFGEGRVTVRALMSARGVPFDVVILPHLSERVFPRPHRGDPLLPDEDRDALARASGRPVPRKSRSTEEERTLFRLAVGAARRRLVLSYPRLDPARGTARAPSLYVFVALEAARGSHLGETELAGDPRVEKVSLARLHPVAPERVLDPRERLLHELGEATRENDVERAARALARYPHARAAVRLDAARFVDRRLTEYDGLLVSPQARAYAVRALQSDALSASRLERYADCPFRFLLAHVLGLEKPEEPELQYSLDPLDRGNLVHRILERFVGARIDQPPEGAQDARARLARIAAEEFTREEEEGTTGYAFLWRAERRLIEANLAQWLTGELGERGGLTTAAVEQAFGAGAGTPPVTLEVGGRTLSFAGRIDRIDRTPDGSRGLVIDYKTGRPKQGLEDDSLLGGRALQLAVYVLAARVLHPEVRSWTAIYDHVSREHRFERIAYHEGEEGQGLAGLAQAARLVVEGVEAGVFLQEPTSCRSCPFDSACGGVAAVAARKSADPRRAILGALREIP